MTALPTDPLELIDRLCPRDGRLLDIGCHTGELLAEVRAHRSDIVAQGVDIDAASVAAARAAGLRAEAASADALPVADQSVDVVTAMDVIEHVPADRRAAVLAEAHRVLIPGGALVIQTPHAGTFAWLDPQNLRHRFPRLYRRVLHAGVRDAAYAGREVVWHHHFTLDEFTGLLGPSWQVESVAYPGMLVVPLADLLSWPFHRLGAIQSRPARALRRLAQRDFARDGGPRRGYELLVVARPV